MKNRSTTTFFELFDKLGNEKDQDTGLPFHILFYKNKEELLNLCVFYNKQRWSSIILKSVGIHSESIFLEEQNLPQIRKDLLGLLN